MAALAGKWNFTSSDNLDALINATVAEGRRDTARNNAQNHKMDLQVNGTNFTYTSTTPESSNTMTFSPGQEFDYVMASGKKVKATWSTLADNKGSIQFSDGAVKAQVLVEANGGELSVTTTLGSTSSVSKYSKA